MDRIAVENMIVNAIAEFGYYALIILGSIITSIIALLVFRWGLMKLETSILGYMHGASGTARFRSLGQRTQRAWSFVDSRLSRRQIMRMENI